MLSYFKKSARPAPENELTNDEQKLETAATTASEEVNDVQNSTDMSPVLSDEDESFLLRVASEAEPPPLPPRPSSSATESTSATESGMKPQEVEEKDAIKPGESSKTANAKRWAENWIEWGIKPTQDLALQKIQDITVARQAASIERQKASDRRLAADTLKSAADSYKTQVQAKTPADAEEAQEETKEVANILSRLDLSSINNRVVGVSKDTQKLLESFNQVLKDIVNGVPTAYGDLEKLLTERQSQLDKIYGGLPPFIQSLVQTIPVKVYAMLAPQVAAAISIDQGKAKAAANQAERKKRSKNWIPSLKSLIGQKGAVAAMLRSIIGFLEMRFPALLAGTNVIVSLAVFRAAVGTEGDDDSLSDLEKGPGLEENEKLAVADSPPHDTTALPTVDDADIEKNVDVLMEQLAKPIEPKKG